VCGEENRGLNQPGHPQTFKIMKANYGEVLGVKSTTYNSVAYYLILL
jgi:hypothetical protein